MNVSQATLSRDLSISVPTIVSWEKGETTPRHHEVYDRLAEYFKVDVSTFYTHPADLPTTPDDKRNLSIAEICELVNRNIHNLRIVHKSKIK